MVIIGVIVAVLMSGGDEGDGGDGLASPDGAPTGTASSTGTASTTGSTTPGTSDGSTTAGSSADGSVSLPVISAPDAPFGWPLAVDPSVLAWGETTNISTPDAKQGVTYSNAPTAAVALGFGSSDGLKGSQSLNLASGEQIGVINVPTPKIGIKSLSPDGTTLAFIHGETKERHQVTVWSYATGQKVQTIDAEQPEQQVKSIVLASPTRLLTFSDYRVDGKTRRTLKVFDVAAGTELKQLAFENAFNLNYCTISPGGKYLAYLVDNNNLLIIEVNSLSVVAAARFNQTGVSQSSGVAFNSTGDRIACLFIKDNKTQIAVVDFATGKSSIAAEFIGNLGYSPITGSIYLGASLEWLPGDQGWCVSGRCIVDAESGQAVWFIESTAKYGSHRRRPAPGGLLVPAGSLIDRKLTLIPVPWESVRGSIAGTANDAEALVKNGSSVSLEVEVGALLHGTAAQTVAALTESLTQRLAADGLTVAENSAVTVYAHYSEKSGPMASSMCNHTQQVQTTNALIKLEWHGSDGKPLRSLEAAVDPSFVRVKEFTAAAYREAMFEKALKQIASCPFPYYIPSGTEQPALTGLTIYEKARASGP